MSHILLDEKNGKVIPHFHKLDDIDLGEGNTLVKINYSSLNYKDMLAFNSNSHVVKQYPIIPGIDFSGTVISSKNNLLPEKQAVLGTGYDIGTMHNGGLSSYINVPDDWLIPIKNSQLKKSMCYGTAGLTAGLSLYYLFQYELNEDKSVPILVTGATGGVGMIAILILKKLGYTNITALIHDKKKAVLLEERGIHQFIYTNDLISNKPLQHRTYQFVIDTVGGSTLACILPQIKYGGVVTSCGNVNGITLNTTMFPFILRNVKLIGVDSVYVNQNLRKIIWDKLFNEWDIHDELVIKEITLGDVISQVDMMNKKHHKGRIVVKID